MVTRRTLLPIVVLAAGGIHNSHAIPITTTETLQIESSASRHGPVDQKVAAALAPLQAGDFTHAETLLKAAQQADPKSPAPLLGMAELEMRRKQGGTAKRRLDEAFKLAPKDPRVSSALGRFHQTRSDFADAERWLKNAVTLAPNLPVLHCDLGDLYLNSLSKPDLAAAAYSAAVSASAKYPAGHYGLGRARMRQGMWAEAAGALRRAAALAPKNPLPRQTLGELFTYRREFDKALDEFDAALKIDPNFVSALAARAEIRLSQADASAALRDFDAIVVLVPKSELAHIGRGRALESAQQFAQAKSAYRKALKINSDSAVAQNNLAWLMLLTKDDLREAMKLAEGAVATAPNVAAFHDTLGGIYRAQGRLADAKHEYARAIEFDEDLQSSVTALRELSGSQ